MTMTKTKIWWTVASMGAVALLASVVPDLKRYIRIMTM